MSKKLLLKRIVSVIIVVMVFAMSTGCSKETETVETDATQATQELTASASQSTETVTTDPIIIKFADFHPLEATNYTAMVKFEELLESKTNGKVDVQLFPAGQLGAQAELIDQVKLGTIDMTWGNPPYFSNLIMDFAVMDLPYMFNDYDQIESVVDGQVGQILNDKLVEQEGMRIIGWVHIGFRDMMTREIAIRSIDDFAGVKFRSPEAFAYIEMFNALGAVPTPMPWTEVYQAMKTNLVDGLETTPEGMVTSKVNEVGKYVIMTNHINTVECITINEEFYQSLPDDVKQAIDETLAELVPWQRETVININETYLQQLADEGCEIIEIDTAPLQAAMQTVWDKFIVNCPSAQELIDLINAERQ